MELEEFKENLRKALESYMQVDRNPILNESIIAEWYILAFKEYMNAAEVLDRIDLTFELLGKSIDFERWLDYAEDCYNYLKDKEELELLNR